VGHVSLVGNNKCIYIALGNPHRGCWHTQVGRDWFRTGSNGALVNTVMNLWVSQGIYWSSKQM
jgi:hypothetical protein